MKSPGFISRLFFLWVDPFIRRNARRAATFDTLLDLPNCIGATQAQSILEYHISRSRPRKWWLARSLMLSIRKQILAVLCISIFVLIGGLSSPMVLGQLLQSLETAQYVAPIWLVRSADLLGVSTTRLAPLFWSFLLFTLAIVSMLSIHHVFFRLVNVATQTHSALRAILYEKVLRLSTLERASSPAGVMVTLMGTDTFKIKIWIQFLFSIWLDPLNLIIASYLLYRLLGVAALFGLMSLLLPMLIMIFVVRYQNRLKKRVLQLTDERTGLIGEVLGQMKTVKFQAWEEQLTSRIQRIRDQEVSLLRTVTLLSSINGLLSNIAPALAMIVTFGSYVFQGGTLDATTVFPAMGLILLLRWTLNMLPESIFRMMDAMISAGRIEKFLDRKEHVPRQTDSPLYKDKDGCLGAVVIHDASFEWKPAQPALSVDELVVRKGELLAVVGTVGSGKSALLLGLLNEIPTRKGSVQINGTLNYVSQQPWIVSDTIRNNIVMGLPFDELRYREALEASCLAADLDHFPQQDQTEIGERGINLSGGQRQRVALARACYRCADIYLLDDPLSALDTEVANSVFDSMVLGALGKASRILVTHRLEYALRADRVAVIINGVLVEIDSPKNLQRSDSHFSELLKYHFKSDIERGSTADLKCKTPTIQDPGPTHAHSLMQSTSSPVPHSIIQTEERDVGAVGLDVFHQYLRFFAPGLLLGVLVLVVIARHASSLGADLWLAKFSDGTEVPIQLFLFGYISLIACLSLFQFIRWYFFLSRGLAAGRRMHEDLLRGILAAPMRFFESNPTGRILNRFSRDLESVERDLAYNLQDCSHCGLDILVVCSFVCFLEPLAAFVLLPIFLMYFRWHKQFRPSSRECQRLESISRSPIFSQFSESIAGVETLRADELRLPFQTRFIQNLDTNSQATYSLTSANRWLGIRLEILAALVLLSVSVAATFAAGSSFPIAVIGLLLTYTISIGSSMNWFVRSIAMAENNLTSFERIRYYSKTAPETQSGALPPSNWPSWGEVRLQNLTVRYRPDLPPVLVDLSAHIPKGSRVGIVGRTGSGKSSLILTMCRILEPMAGHIEIDGVKTSTLKLDSLRSALTVVPQEPVLFSGTLREALDPMNRASDVSIAEALERVELRDMIAALPQGLRTQVQEGGSNFSCGERQLLCLARALLSNSKVIIMDEATASIDVKTDAMIQRTIRREFSDVTVLVVAHRLGTVIDSDLILVLEAGRLVEMGAPEHLLSKTGSVLGKLIKELQPISRSEQARSIS